MADQHEPPFVPILRRKRVDYTSLGLRGNPFPVSGLSAPGARYPLIDRGMEDEVHGFIDETLNGREYGGLIVIGEFGSGKTYTLRYIEALLSAVDISPDVEEVLAVYVERPEPTVLGLVREVCERIGRPRVRNILLEIIFTNLAEVLSRSGEEVPASVKGMLESEEKHLFSANWSLSEVLASPESALNPLSTLETLKNSRIDPRLLVDYAVSTLLQAIPLRDERGRDVVRHLALFALESGDRSARWWRKFLNGRVSDEGGELFQISAHDVWFYIRSTLAQAGYAMVYWLIDEFEELETQQTGARAVRSFLADFRDLIDANSQGFALIVAMKTHVWQVTRSLNPAFTARFSRVVPLKPCNEDELRQMLGNRLRNVRLKTERGAPEDVNPFDEMAVRELIKVSGGNARTAVEACHVLLWHAAATGASVVSADMVRRIREINRSYFDAQGGA